MKNKLMYVKSLEQCLVHRKCFVTISDYVSFPTGGDKACCPM